MGFRGVLAGVLSVVLVGGGSAFPSLAAEGDALSPWEGPYGSGEAPVGEVREPRDVVDIDLERPVLEPGDEVVEQRTESSKTFVGEAPGLFETRVFTEPVHVATDEGWVDVDTDLVADGDRWVPETSPVGVSLAGDAEDESLARVELQEGVSIGWGWAGVADTADAEGPVETLARSADGAGVSWRGTRSPTRGSRTVWVWS